MPRAEEKEVGCGDHQSRRVHIGRLVALCPRGARVLRPEAGRAAGLGAAVPPQWPRPPMWAYVSSPGESISPSVRLRCGSARVMPGRDDAAWRPSPRADLPGARRDRFAGRLPRHPNQQIGSGRRKIPRRRGS